MSEAALNTNNPDWMELLCDAVSRSSISAVALELGYSRTAISLVLSGKYQGSTARIETAVLDHFVHARHCPVLERVISLKSCSDNTSRPMPTSSPQALRLWRKCQACAFHPKNREKRSC